MQMTFRELPSEPRHHGGRGGQEAQSSSKTGFAPVSPVSSVVESAILQPARCAHYSVETISSRAAAAARNVSHGSVAHLTRTGNRRTPANADSTPRSTSDTSSGAVIMFWKRSNSRSASSTVLPLTLSVISDADALAIAQPKP